MVKAFIISGICFTIGNVIWDQFDDPRIYYIPLSVFLFISALYVRKTSKSKNKIINYLLDYLAILALGNIVKQVFYYNDTIKQVNDYIWGGLVTIGLLIMIVWEIRKQKSGKR